MGYLAVLLRSLHDGSAIDSFGTKTTPFGSIQELQTHQTLIVGFSVVVHKSTMDVGEVNVCRFRGCRSTGLDRSDCHHKCSYVEQWNPNTISHLDHPPICHSWFVPCGDSSAFALYVSLWTIQQQQGNRAPITFSNTSVLLIHFFADWQHFDCRILQDEIREDRSATTGTKLQPSDKLNNSLTSCLRVGLISLMSF